MGGQVIFDNISTTIAMYQHLKVHARRKKEKDNDRQSLTYVVRRRPKTKSSCVIGSLGVERMNVIRRLGVVNLT